MHMNYLYITIHNCITLFQGFIEFIVSPTFVVLSDMVEQIAAAQQLITPSTTPNNCASNFEDPCNHFPIRIFISAVFFCFPCHSSSSSSSSSLTMPFLQTSHCSASASQRRGLASLESATRTRQPQTIRTRSASERSPTPSLPTRPAAWTIWPEAAHAVQREWSEICCTKGPSWRVYNCSRTDKFMMLLKVFNSNNLLAGKKLVVVLDRIWDPILAENRAKWQEMATRGRPFLSDIICERICPSTVL